MLLVSLSVGKKNKFWAECRRGGFGVCEGGRGQEVRRWWGWGEDIQGVGGVGLVYNGVRQTAGWSGLGAELFCGVDVFKKRFGGDQTGKEIWEGVGFAFELASKIMTLVLVVGTLEEVVRDSFDCDS